MPDTKLGDVQQSCLKALREFGRYPGGWYWINKSTTVRILDSLVRKGLATKDQDGTYRPVDPS